MKLEWVALLHLLEGSGLSPSAAGRLALELAESAGALRLQGSALMNRCRRIIQLGREARAQEGASTTFARAVQAALESRQDRRPRTRAEFGGICRRLLRARPELARRRVRSFTAEDCRSLLEQTFASTRQRAKGRVILHGVFAHALREGWCRSNPVAALRAPVLRESEVQVLRCAEIRRLLRMARLPEHGSCMAPLGLMLWAGVRPAEVARLHWEDVDEAEGVIVLRARHSKTGGARHITLHPVLRAWLSEVPGPHEGPLCPPCWARRWKRLREAAGLTPWQQDVLRHSFASYHIKQWHDYARLQLEMGHRSSELLRTRYLSMRGITAADAARFWAVRGLWRASSNPA